MVIVIDSKNPGALELFGPLGDVRLLPTAEITPAAIQDADVVIVRTETRIDREFLEHSRVRFVGTATIGTDHVDLEYLRSRGIGFASAPGSNANSVAEYIVAALLTLAVRTGRPLAGQSIGVVGVGNVGRRVVSMAQALGLTVLKNDPPLRRQSGGSDFLPLDDLMEADIVSLHVPLTTTGDDPTWHLFDETRLSRMKKGAVLLNTSRGAVADNKALVRAHAAGNLGGSVLDVWEGEPHINPELVELVSIGTPHIAGYSYDGKLNAIRMMYEAVCASFELPIAPADETDTDIDAIEVASLASTEGTERFFLEIVRRAYDIGQDDASLRSILTLPEKDRGAFFRRLRAGYRIRREFRHARLTGNPPGDQTARVLSSLGFALSS